MSDAHHVAGLATVATCSCGAQFRADDEDAALAQLLEHRRREESKTYRSTARWRPRLYSDMPRGGEDE